MTLLSTCCNRPPNEGAEPTQGIHDSAPWGFCFKCGEMTDFYDDESDGELKPSAYPFLDEDQAEGYMNRFHVPVIAALCLSFAFPVYYWFNL